MSELKNIKHEMFCQEYLKDFNGKRSYQAVYKSDNRVAESNASKLLRNTKVRQRLAELIEKRKDRTQVDADAFLEQLNYMAMFDPEKVLGWDGETLTLRSFEDIPVEARRMITSVKDKKEYSESGDYLGCSIEVKFAPKEKIMDMLARHLGLYNDSSKVRLEGEVTTQVVNLNIPDNGRTRD